MGWKKPNNPWRNKDCQFALLLWWKLGMLIPNCPIFIFILLSNSFYFHSHPNMLTECTNLRMHKLSIRYIITPETHFLTTILNIITNTLLKYMDVLLVLMNNIRKMTPIDCTFHFLRVEVAAEFSFMIWQEKSSVYVCELCHENGKSLVSLPSTETEHEKLQETSKTHTHEGIPTPDSLICSSHSPMKNGKVCNCITWNNFDLIPHIMQFL